MSPQEWLYLVGGVGLLGLGLGVGLARWRSLPALAFAAFAVSTGLLSVMDAAYEVFPWPALPWLVMALLVPGAWGLFLFFPRRLAPLERPAAWAAAVAGSVWAFIMALGIGESVSLLDAQNHTLLTFLSAGLGALSSAGIVGVALLLPLRARRTPDAAEARSLGILAIGIVAFSAGTFADLARVARGEGGWITGVLEAAYVLAPTLLWLGVSRGSHGRVASAVIVASVLLYVPSVFLGPLPAWAAGRFLGALLLGYAVLRGQIAGLDLKVRFVVSKSTIAAAFIAVFFLASEVAQQFFGTRYDNGYVGIAAAGLLVFALAPLQRAAERLAARAVPVDGVRPAADPRREDTYRRAVRYTLRDAQMTRAEELHLARLAVDLQIAADRAVELRHEVERERAPAG